MQSLLFVTHEYPINRGDTSFIKNEIPYTSRKFDKIHILCLGKHRKTDSISEMPKNTSVIFLKHKKIKKIILLFLLLFNPVFYSELHFLVDKRKLSVQSLRLCISFFTEALLLQICIKQILNNDIHISLIYTYWYSSETMGALLLQERYANIPCVTRTHGYDLYEFRNNQNYQPYKLWMDKKISKIFFISRHGYDYYISTFAGDDKKKYSIDRLGILNNYPLKEKYKKDTNIFYLLSCSYIVPVKRIHLIVKTLAEINDYTIHWVHIGDGSEKKNIVSMADNILLNKKNISFEFKGFMTNEQVMQFYNEQYFDCFISTSKYEGLPVSMMEAISFGIPIIATNVGGVSELVGNAGILLGPNGEIPEIKKALIDFYNFPDDKRNTMRQAARLLWESDFNAEINHARFSGELLSMAKKT